jgi:hypothetical protein
VSVAASDSSSAVVIGTQDGPFVSADAGATVSRASLSTLPTSGGVAFNNLGDPEVAVGAPDAAGHQALYYSTLSMLATGTTPLAALAVFKSTEVRTNSTWRGEIFR